MDLFNEIGQNQTEQVVNYIDNDLKHNRSAKHAASMQTRNSIGKSYDL
jgi:hypothetical protein